MTEPGDDDDDPFERVFTGALVDAEEVARRLRAADVAAMIDPEQLRAVDLTHDGHRAAFDVVVPRVEAAAAHGVLHAWWGREGDASDEEIHAELLAASSAPAGSDRERARDRSVLWTLVIGTVALPVLGLVWLGSQLAPTLLVVVAGLGLMTAVLARRRRAG